ncbi:type II secretion system ATPase GspE [Gallaecimonas sp. GXIMD4217]|uniref:type II secretion system ATPase GspE n=1 Tax=Gallaecimonas sp. GXIMD4217 TaxID=3131927 RepID=UPI00311AC7BA
MDPRPQSEMETALGETLVGKGVLSATDHARVQRMRQSSDDPLPLLLTKLGLVSEKDMAEQLSELLDLPLASSKDFPAEPLLPQALSERFLKEYHLLPLEEADGDLQLAMANPLDGFAKEAVALATGKAIRPQVAPATEIDAAIDRLYGKGQGAMGDILAGLGAKEEVTDAEVEQLKDMASEAPVIRLVNLTIQKAFDARASDIHIEPFENRLLVRFRIDGVLQEGEAPPPSLTAAVISRIKIMARLNIAERRLPQDGRIKTRVQGKEVDIRVSTVPTMHGESVVMRLLRRDSVVLDFAALGFLDETRARLEQVLRQPNGMLLVTGPTGSGKSTTLYTALDKLNTTERKLITVEDPVEYQLEGVNQIQVKPDIGLTFANALRSIVRQDPDVIMVGEMRDLETAGICVQSALTGHLVLSTLHTNDAASSVTRLLEMGVEDYLLTSTLNAVIGQRLVRVLCPHCKEPYRPLPEMLREMGIHKAFWEQSVTLYRPKGCEQCQGSGYFGRVAIQELLVMSDALRRLVLDHADAAKLLAVAKQDGMHSMYEDGCRKALEGITSIEEVIRVTQEA